MLKQVVNSRSQGLRWSLIFTVYISVSAAGSLFFSMLNGYFGMTMTERISYLVEDGWCDTGGQGLGAHCFSDFGSNYTEAKTSVAYGPGAFSMGNPPLVVAAFSLISKLSYNEGLFLWLAGIFFASVGLAIVVASKAKTSELKILVFATLGFANLGSISALDRGNPIPVISFTLLVALTLFERNQRSFLAPVLVGLVATLKFWTPLFAIYFAVRRRWVPFLGSLLVWFGFSVGALVASPVGWLESLKLHWSWLTNREYGQGQLPASHSIYSLVQRLACDSITAPSNCIASGFPMPDFWSVVFGATLITLFILLANFWRNVPYLPAVPLAVLPVIALPEAMVYNVSLLTLVVGVIFVASTSVPRLEIPPKSEGLLAWFLGSSLLSLVVVPIRFDQWFGSPFSSIVVPGMFSIVTLAVLVHLIGNLRGSGRGSRLAPWASKIFAYSLLIRRTRRDKNSADA